jgi:hypothetical protein
VLVNLLTALSAMDVVLWRLLAVVARPLVVRFACEQVAACAAAGFAPLSPR